MKLMVCALSMLVAQECLAGNINVDGPLPGTPAAAGAAALQSIVRVVCPDKNRGGTGFFHKSGRVITAAHNLVCSEKSLEIWTPTGEKLFASNVVADAGMDLAIIQLKSGAAGRPFLPISLGRTLNLGILVTTWGFPSGYTGAAPLLSAGYLSGVQDRQFVINAAFNSGNSGGPVIDARDGMVIGVVASKLAPLPKLVEVELEALSAQKSGQYYTLRDSDGVESQRSETSIIADVLYYLRSQTQLVVGYAVSTPDLRDFIAKQGLEP